MQALQAFACQNGVGAVGGASVSTNHSHHKMIPIRYLRDSLCFQCAFVELEEGE